MKNELEKDDEDQLDWSCEKWSIAYGPVGEEYPTYLICVWPCILHVGKVI